MVNAKLVVIGGDAKSKEVTLRLPAIIGRGKDSTLVVPHALVSRKHCEIFERNGLLIVKDLESLNGTFVNNYRIKGEQPLHPGELLTLGNITFRAVYESTVSRDQRVAQPKPQSIPTFESDPVRVAVPTTSMNETVSAEQLIKKSLMATDQSTNAASSKPMDNPKLQANPKPVVIATSADSESIDFEKLDFSSPQRSISVSAIDELPVDTHRQISFVGVIGDESPTPVSGIDAIDFQDLDPQNRSCPVDERALDSFVRKVR